MLRRLSLFLCILSFSFFLSVDFTANLDVSAPGIDSLLGSISFVSAYLLFYRLQRFSISSVLHRIQGLTHLVPDRVFAVLDHLALRVRLLLCLLLLLILEHNHLLMMLDASLLQLLSKAHKHIGWLVLEVVGRVI